MVVHNTQHENDRSEFRVTFFNRMGQILMLSQVAESKSNVGVAVSFSVGKRLNNIVPVKTNLSYLWGKFDFLATRPYH